MKTIGVNMISQNNYVQLAIPKLDGHYNHWSILMEFFLRSKQYWSLVKNRIPIAAGEADLIEKQRKPLKIRS